MQQTLDLPSEKTTWVHGSFNCHVAKRRLSIGRSLCGEAAMCWELQPIGASNFADHSGDYGSRIRSETLVDGLN